KTHDDLRLYELHFLIEPGPARSNLAIVRLLVNATLALVAARPLEVLHGVCDVHGAAIDARFLERGVQQPPGRSDEGVAFLVFLIAGLLAHDHHASARRALTKHRLRANRPELATAAEPRCLAQRTQRRPRRNEIRSGAGGDRKLRARRHVSARRPQAEYGRVRERFHPRVRVVLRGTPRLSR